MASVIVHYSKRYKGFLIRLVQSNKNFFVNVLTGKGALHSYNFTSLATAYTFLNAFIKSLKKS
ncbi:MAG: hypothetical protein AB1432_00250 [Bacteroidota bacterium]